MVCSFYCILLCVQFTEAFLFRLGLFLFWLLEKEVSLSPPPPFLSRGSPVLTASPSPPHISMVLVVFGKSIALLFGTEMHTWACESVITSPALAAITFCVPTD
uniref:Uncharacterized protein n=1 Tax=Sphaerodactylus townsendi TaxID=933632 RepID=A0ACB8FL50_9SAUR